jgi:ADP-heptose:LPS heptosyltransferase
MRKLILKCELSLGDIVMLTAAVRDLHFFYPGQFQTDVRTFFPELWEHNPFITPLADDDPEVETVPCTYRLIDRCNETPYHCLQGFVEFFNSHLKLGIHPTAFKGDIYLSAREKAWYSQVHELADRKIPFWIIANGGKYDVTVKWWQTERYQRVVDHFRGRIQFVQVGAPGLHHPRLDGVIDLRGRTDVRQLIRLVYHAQGVLCPLTSLMHLAAAVETKVRRRNRPCVVVAGGREPAHWGSYPDHQFIHTNGLLSCSGVGGCWKDRTVPLRDGDSRDRKHNLCANVSGGLPRCMDLISPEEVIRRIEWYFAGGLIGYLRPRERTAALRAVAATVRNRYDRLPLTLHNAGTECDRFVRNIPPMPEFPRPRGIVICGGGIRYFVNAWICIQMLRRLDCRLPIQLWYLGPRELDGRMQALLADRGVETVDAARLRRKVPARILDGWALKSYALLNSPFREVLFLDADNVPIVNPEFVFHTAEFAASGALFWPDTSEGVTTNPAIWRSCGLRMPGEPEFESGQMVFDKLRCWRALSLARWFNDQADFYFQHMHGDKETFHLAFRKLKQPYHLVPHPMTVVSGVLCQHDFNGRRIFQHRSRDKWDFKKESPMKDLPFEAECHQYLAELRGLWDGTIQKPGPRRRAKIVKGASGVSLSAGNISGLRAAG